MALGGSISDFFSIELVAPWLHQGPRTPNPFGGLIGVPFPIVPYTSDVVNALVSQSLGSNITHGEEVGYVDTEIPLGLPNPDYQYGGVLGGVISAVARAGVSEVLHGGAGATPDETGPFPGAPVSDLPEFPEGSIYGPGGTWGENPLPPDIYDLPPADTGPGELPPAPIPEEGGPVSEDIEGRPAVAIDWGDVFGGVLTDIGAGLAGGGSAPPAGFVPGATTLPTTVTVNTQTGKVTPCRRRRRRRLLTSSDLNDLAALKTIVGGGQALNGAVIKAVRR